MIKQKAWIRAVVLKAGYILLGLALAANGEPLLDADFSGAAGSLAGHSGWIGRDNAIQLNGKGMASLIKSDGFAKHSLTIPQNADRIGVCAKVKFAARPGSAMRNHHIVGKEQPAWIALGFMDNPSKQAGLAASKLSLSVSSNGKTISVGMGRSVGAAEPVFGVCQAAGNGDCDLALDYDFSTATATALLNGSPVLTGKVKLTANDFSMVGFQLRRITSSGGIDELNVDADVPAPQVFKPELPLGSRTNREVLRAHEIEARIAAAKTASETLAALKEGWNNPPATYRPHTRWWWPGNAVTKEGITWQLEQMKDKGFGGVEIMSFMKIYDKGNIEFDSPEFVEMVAYTVHECRRLGMEVSLSLGPGWNHGNSQVPEADRAKVLVFSEQDVSGGKQELTLALPQDPPYAKWNKKKPVALVAVAQSSGGHLDLSRRIDLSSLVDGVQEWDRNPDIRLTVDVPDGNWRLMTFWTAYTGQKCAAENYEPRSWVVDHLSKDAVHRYAEVMNEKYQQAFGGDFGQTVDSFFGDSFELQQDFSYWSDHLFKRFQREKGYDLRPYLPLLIYGDAPEAPYVRYDFGHFLHELGMEGTISELSSVCEDAGIDMRQQPHYRFTADLIEASGVLQRPETEMTRRSFDPKAYPHKLTTSGAQFYPSPKKKWVSAEAFTFINDKYRTTMEEIKRGTDLFLRDGITQFYNHGYFYTPEKELAPSRDLLWMNRISHVNTWWPWYRGLADYQARACFLSRQGRSECDVLVYAPYPTMWSERVKYPVLNVRDLPFGPLAKILVANGYDFDCVNDDLLLNHTQIKDGKIIINGFDYSVLILPRTLTLSPETLGKISAFVKSGGTVMALHDLPQRSTGLMNHAANDTRLAGLRDELFSSKGGVKKVGRGQAWFFPDFDGLDYVKGWWPDAVEWSPTAPLSPGQAGFVQALRSRLTPDFEIADKSQSDGLTFRHTKIGDVDCWFICNLQPKARKTEVLLDCRAETVEDLSAAAGRLSAVPARQPFDVQIWDAMDGSFQPVENVRFADDGRPIIPINLEPWQSQFVLLTPKGAVDPLPVQSGFSDIGKTEAELSNDWNVSFQGLENFRTNLVMKTLTDWTKFQGLENFSGAAIYRTEFDWKPETGNLKPEIILDLGEVCHVAAVLVNGLEVGNVWMQPYRLDISKQIKPGRNRLEIRVANLLWNYVAGLKEPKPIPEDLQAHYGTTWNQKYNGWNSLLEIRHKYKDQRLPSGLIGPVQLRIYSK